MLAYGFRGMESLVSFFSLDLLSSHIFYLYQYLLIYIFVYLFFLITSGNGTTSAVELLLDCLGLHHVATSQDQADRPVIFVGPFEHHSNLLPWRELPNVDIVMVPEHPVTHNVDIEALDRLLTAYSNRWFKLGTFTVASNVTGTVLTDEQQHQLVATLHKHDALACLDYATGAPYLSINMNPIHPNYTPEQIAKDIIVYSGHKLLGGIGTPGVLIIKKHLINTLNPPKRSGGGTVFYVTSQHHRFLSNEIVM